MESTLPQKGHPKQLTMLFFAEMWERFSFYGMRALLILFMTKEFLFTDEKAYGVYAAYGALVYTTPFIGGLLADRILGYRKAVLFGGIMMAIGHFLMAGPDFVEGEGARSAFFYVALAFLITGNGFFKPNISSIVGSLYEEGDPRRDAGFTIFYMGVNLGAFLAPLVCGTIGELISWSLGFSIAGVGMLAGLIVFWRGQGTLGERGNPPNLALLTKKIAGLSTENLIYVLSFAAVALFAYLVQNHDIMDNILRVGGLVVLIYLLFIAFSSTKVERERMFVVIILIVFSTVFWAFFEQAGSSINLFTDRNVSKGAIPTSIFQSVNPLFILLLAPIFSALWVSLGKKNRDLSIPFKFALGILQLGLGFGAFVIGAAMAGSDGMVGLFWLLLGYMLHTSGELCLSPVGLSMVTKLSPKKIVAMVMGAWFLSSAFAHNLGGIIASYTSTSAYTESAFLYSPNINYVGDDAFSFKAYKEVILDKSGNVVEPEKGVDYEKDPNYDVKKFYTDEVMVNMHTVETVDKVKPQFKPDAYTVRRSLKPGGKMKLETRIKHLDPVGDLMNIKRDESKLLLGKVAMDGDSLTYTAPADTSNLIDVVEFDLCEVKKPDQCNKLRFVFTVDNKAYHKPVALATSYDVYVLKRTVLAKNEAYINALDYVSDADGGKLKLELVKKSDFKNKGYAKSKSTLNSYVDSSKTIHVYSKVFWYICLFAIGTSIVLILLVPILKKWTHGIK